MRGVLFILAMNFSFICIKKERKKEPLIGDLQAHK
jgi:hypothetical protein